MITQAAWKRRITTAVAALALVHGADGHAVTREAQVKAAYVYKLASFVRWPPGAFHAATSPLRLCVAGRSDVQAVLSQLVRGQRAEGRELVVVAVSPGSTSIAGNCHALFMGGAGHGERQLLQSVAGAPVLTISDRSTGGSGGLIELVERRDTIRFVIHRDDAERRGLVLSSKLLAVAESVEP